MDPNVIGLIRRKAKFTVAEAIFGAVRRHALYSNRILLADPFPYPLMMREEYSPLYHPEQHRAVTIKWVFLWFSLMPWIEAGLVTFTRTPGDFSPDEFHEILEIEREKFESTPQLQAALDRQMDGSEESTEFFCGNMPEYMMLLTPDERLRELCQRARPDVRESEVVAFLKDVQRRRDEHPYFVEPLSNGSPGQILHDTTGATYEAAKRVCAITNSHIITDLAVRWKEVEVDHAHASGRTPVWSPFAKALQNAGLKVLENTPLSAALELRRAGRLESMRHFFNRVWRECRDPDSYNEANAANLAAELDDRIREAEEEWVKIDRELFKWFGSSLSTLVATPLVGFVPAATAAVVGGATSLARAQWQRKSFQRRFPAGFFLGKTR